MFKIVTGAKRVEIVGSQIISCGDKTIRIWSIEDGKKLDVLRHQETCHNFDLNREKQLLAVAHESGITVWDFSTKTKIKDIDGPGYLQTKISASDVQFNKSGNKLIVGNVDGQVLQIDIE